MSAFRIVVEIEGEKEAKEVFTILKVMVMATPGTKVKLMRKKEVANDR